MVIPKATKALFPNAPSIEEPAGEINSVVAASLIRAGNIATKGHNTQTDKNLKLLRDDQDAALKRQNTANYEAWKDCQEPPPEPEKRKKRFGIFGSASV